MKKHILIILSFFIILSINAQERKKVGVVLSGGGAKGVAHVGALKVIEEAGIPIDIVVGTSMGSIVGGLYSIGYTPTQLDSMIKVQDWRFLLSDRMRRKQKTFTEKVETDKYIISMPFHRKPKELGMPDGIVKGQNLHDLFSGLTISYHDSVDFNKLPIPFACVAVDLKAGKEIVFHSGRLSESMRASMAIPAAFTPVRLDSMVLVDGGLLNNYPVDVALSMGAEIIIGVDVQADPEDRENIVTVVDMISRLTDIVGMEKYSKNIENTDVYIKVDVKGYTAASFNQTALDTLVNRGEIAARAEWQNLEDLKKKIGISDNFVPKRHGPFLFSSLDEEIYIHSITFTGIKNYNKDKLVERCKLQENKHVKIGKIQQAIDALYALQTYTNIHYNLSKNGEGYDLEFILEDSPQNGFSLGIRLDNEEIAAVQVGAQYQFNTRIPSKAMLTGRLGKRSHLRLDYMLLPTPLHHLTLSYMFQYNDINFYKKGDRQFNTTYGHHLGEICYSTIFNQNLGIGLGLRYEYYNYDSFLYNEADQNINVKAEGFFSYYANLRYETMNRKSYPTKGTSLRFDFSLFTDNLSGYDGGSPFGAVSMWWGKAFSPTRRFSILPSLYGRVLFGNNPAYPFLNALGGDTPGHYVSHQIPFTGINYLEVVGNSAFVGKLQFRERLGRRNYISLSTNYGLVEDDLGKIFKGKQLIGVGLGYGYESIIGPIDASINISNRTKKVGFYLNAGYRF